MAALHSRCGHYVFILWFLLSFFFVFLAWSQRSEIGCLPYFHTWCGLSADLECRSETCCTRLAENTARKKVAKNRTTLLGYIFATKARIDKQQYVLQRSPLCQISPPLVQREGCRTPRLKLLLRFDQNMEYKRPAGAYPLRDFQKICRVCTPF